MKLTIRQDAKTIAAMTAAYERWRQQVRELRRRQEQARAK